ncbi:hypothetical protein LEN26_000807 [Aphanomyces euteiches]|nr:hypothetical protein LEN26_000807 [Aphanomyces euteiches]
MATAASSAYKTAHRHYLQYLKAPLPGVSITPVQADKYHVNTTLLEGPYEGIAVHWELSIPDTYPYTPPLGGMAPGNAFNEAHHNHVIDDFGICCDVLGNDATLYASAKSYFGWTPSANFKTLMVYLQPFLAEPHGVKASRKVIGELRAMNKNYMCATCGHSTKQFVPPPDKPSNDDSFSKWEIIEHLPPPISRAKRELFCPVLCQNIMDEQTLCLGYPFRIECTHYTLSIDLFPEFLLFKAYREACVARDKSGFDMRTPSGHTYTHWLPLYLSHDHYNSNKGLHQAEFTVATTNGLQCISIVDLLTKAMNRQVLAVMDGSGHESEAAIIAYANLLRLLRHIVTEHPEYQQAIDRIVTEFISDPTKRLKKYVPNLGEFYVKLCVSTAASIDDVNIVEILVRESFARQIRWIRQQDHECLDDDSMEIPTRLSRLFKHSTVSNKIMIFAMEMAKVFGQPDFDEKMDAHFGLPVEDTLIDFQNRVKHVKPA